MNNFVNSISTARNITLTKEKILKRCEKLQTAKEKIVYLKKIISDCDRIINLAGKLDGEYLDVNLLKKTEQNIDKNLILFLEELGKPPADLPERQIKSPLVFRQPRKYYIVSPIDGGRVCDIQNAIEAMKIIKDSYADKIIAIEAVEKKAEGALVSKAERIMIKSSLADVVRIFETMKATGIISLKTEVKQFAELFFYEVTDKISFEKKYNATKSRMKKEGSSSKSEELFIFVITMINTSYKGKGAEIERIIKHLEAMQKNII